jgi:HPt (histidine-containing phosphotransfer) domain-containing protein
MSDDRQKCLAAGCTTYLSKPVAEEKLINTIHEYLGTGSSTVNDELAPVPVTIRQVQPAEPDPAGVIRSSFSYEPRIMQIVPDFVNGLPAKVRAISDSLKSNDLATVQQIAHQLLGACGGYGFDPVSGPARKLEQSIQEKQDAETISSNVEALTAMIRRIEGYPATNAAAAGGGV